MICDKADYVNTVYKNYENAKKVCDIKNRSFTISAIEKIQKFEDEVQNATKDLIISNNKKIDDNYNENNIENFSQMIGEIVITQAPYGMQVNESDNRQIPEITEENKKLAKSLLKQQKFLN